MRRHGAPGEWRVQPRPSDGSILVGDRTCRQERAHDPCTSRTAAGAGSRPGSSATGVDRGRDGGHERDHLRLHDPRRPDPRARRVRRPGRRHGPDARRQRGSLGLQATGARRVSTSTGDLDSLEHDVSRRDVLVGRALGAADAGRVAAGARSRSTSTPGWSPRWSPRPPRRSTVMGGQAGILQGERRWGPLAGIYLGVGLGRLAFGAAALVVDRDRPGRHPRRDHRLGRAGRRRLVGAAAPQRRADTPLGPGAPASRSRAGPAAACSARRRQLAGAAGVLRALQRRRDHRPEHPDPSTRRVCTPAG